MSYELKRVDYFSGAHKRPEFLAIHPNGAVPALMDGDFALWLLHEAPVALNVGGYAALRISTR
jgi:glutathione S-transferase